ncbi:hypothetical protein F5051DRAFT_502890 [Lentinula edodes]|nr:hypothetical protein F5051DRAFT_502890 [Lentinula edodes]
MRLFVAVVIYDSIQTRYAYPIRGIGIGIIASSEAGSVEPKEREKDREDEHLRRIALTPLKQHTTPKQTRRDECNGPLREQRDWIEKLSVSTPYEEGWGEVQRNETRWSQDTGIRRKNLISRGSARITRIAGICGSSKPGGGGTKEVYRGTKRRRLLEGTYHGKTGGQEKKGEERGGPPRWRTAESTASSFTASRKRLRGYYRAAKQRV